MRLRWFFRDILHFTPYKLSINIEGGVCGRNNIVMYCNEDPSTSPFDYVLSVGIL